MSRPLRAIFENGVFRPLEPVTLDEHQHVLLDVTPASSDTASTPPAPAPSALVLATQLGLIGCAGDDPNDEPLPDDLSTNPAYLDGFGETSSS